MEYPGYPFANFLSFLRARERELCIGVSQCEECARLVKVLGEHADPRVLGRGLAALLARTPEEVNNIEALFFEYYREAFDFATYGPDVPRGVRQGELRAAIAQGQKDSGRARARWKKLGLYIAAGILLLGLATMGVGQGYRPAHPETALKSDKAQQEPPVPPEPTKEKPPELVSPLVLPVPPSEVFWVRRVGFALIAPLLILALLFMRQRLDRSYRRQIWRQIRGELSGPTVLTLCTDALEPSIERADLEEMATLLGRSRSQDEFTTFTLNGEQTVEATMKAGGMPRLVFDRWAMARSIVVLLDTCSDMNPYLRQAVCLIDGLRARGVNLVVRYFDGDAGMLSEKPHSRSELLRDFCRSYPHAGLLVMSTGRGATNPLSRKPAEWLDELKQFERRIWLHPIPCVKLWRPVLRQSSFPFRVLPMTSKGLLTAAHELALGPEGRYRISDDLLFPARPATAKEVERLRQMLSVWPDAPIELAVYLKAKFCPEVPDDVLARVWASSGDLSGRTLCWSEADLGQLLAGLRRGEEALPPAQRLEEKVRRKVLELLQASEPKEMNSLAHLLWRMLCAMQKLYLHDEADQRGALQTLRELAAGPIAEDVADALVLVDDPDEMRGRSQPLSPPVLNAIRSEVQAILDNGTVSPASPPKPGTMLPSGIVIPAAQFAWSWPTRTLAGAALLLLSLGAMHKLGFATHSLLHQKAYTLKVQQESIGALGRPIISIEANAPEVPSVVTLCQDQRCQRRYSLPIALKDGKWKGTIEQPNTRQNYHVRAQLPSGQILYSNQVDIDSPEWVAAAKPSPAKTSKRQGASSLHPGSSSKLANTPEPLVINRPARAGITIDPTRTRDTYPRREQLISFSDDRTETLEPEPSLDGAASQASDPARRSPGTSVPSLVPESVVMGRSDKYDADDPPDKGAPGIDLPEPPPLRVSGQMVAIRGGRFQMEADAEWAKSRSYSELDVSDFYLDETEVTVAAYTACTDDLRCQRPTDDATMNCNFGRSDRMKHPMNCVSKQEAAAFCRWAGKRLPTEAEWEYAARGPVGHTYPWGNTFNGSRLCWKPGEATCEVRQFPSGSTAGLHDMAGNVLEWVATRYRTCFDRLPGCERRSSYVVRGGSWNSATADEFRTSKRRAMVPISRYDIVGFRCASSRKL